MDRLESKSTMKYHKMRKSGHHFSCDRFSPSPHEDDPFFSFVSFKRTENESHFQHANDKSKQSTLLCVCVFVSQGWEGEKRLALHQLALIGGDSTRGSWNLYQLF